LSRELNLPIFDLPTQWPNLLRVYRHVPRTGLTREDCRHRIRIRMKNLMLLALAFFALKELKMKLQGRSALVVVLSIFVISATKTVALAETFAEEHGGERSLGFIAPTIAGKGNVYSPATGEILYDSSDSTFYGRTHGGAWTALGSSTSVVSSTTSAERIERATVVCNGTPSVTPSGSWLSTKTTISGGQCTYTISSGLFNASPDCVQAVDSASNQVAGSVQVAASGGTYDVTVGCASGSSLANCTNFASHLICMGAR
jgi:hypothetical protein